jgi:excisionase family DNA binding protein
VQNDRLLTLEEVAGYLQVPVKTLYDWRHRGLGPRGLRVGRYVRYRQSALDTWLDTCVDPAHSPPGVGSRRTAGCSRMARQWIDMKPVAVM